MLRKQQPTRAPRCVDAGKAYPPTPPHGWLGYPTTGAPGAKRRGAGLDGLKMRSDRPRDEPAAGRPYPQIGTRSKL